MKSNQTRTLTAMICLVGTMVVTRIVLVGGPPNIKPTAFLAIFSGILGGPMFGFVVGSLGMAISDLFFGIGPWTLITSLCMGIVGFLGGFVIFNKDTSRVGLALVGFGFTMVYDVLTSVIFAVMFGYSWWMSIVSLYVPFLGTFYPFGLAHELTTALLFLFTGSQLIRRSLRIIER